MKAKICGAAGLVGAFVTAFLGGWDTALQALVVFMAIDYVTGIVVAAVFKKSTKTESGTLSSAIGLKGLFRKAAMLSAVIVAYYLDKVAGTDFVRDACCLALICNEGLSIIENFGLMGVPIPEVVINAIDVLKDNKEKK